MLWAGLSVDEWFCDHEKCKGENWWKNRFGVSKEVNLKKVWSNLRLEIYYEISIFFLDYFEFYQEYSWQLMGGDLFE